MDRVETHYCRACAFKTFAKWKGRPHKDTLPLLPKLTKGTCQRCGGTESLNSGNIVWQDPRDDSGHWGLAEAMEENGMGLPYFSEMRCPKCQQRSIVSELTLPAGTTEYKCNCQLCGVLDLG